MPSKLPPGTALIGQSGGPTAVINESLVAVVRALRGVKGVKRILGMRHGVNGLVKDPPAVLDLTRARDSLLERVARTPAAALGSSRDKPDPEYCRKILASCERLGARLFFYVGGNDSSDTCRIVSELAVAQGYDLRCFHVPKTVDNDLVGSDHTPGYPSSARFNAMAFMADSLDNASLPGVKINVVMGRNAGFLTAASALAKGTGKDADRNGPHLVYVPEVPFDRQRFIAEVERVYARLGRCQVAVSEGIQDAEGRPIVTTLVEGLARDAHGNVQLSGVAALGDALAEVVRENIKGEGGKAIRVRADTFGYLQRCWPDRSPVDVKEARLVGRAAVALAVRGERSGSIALVRTGKAGGPYGVQTRRVELADVAGKTRTLPRDFLETPHGGPGGSCGVSAAFVRWCRPLVGKLPEFARLTGD